MSDDNPWRAFWYDVVDLSTDEHDWLDANLSADREEKKDAPNRKSGDSDEEESNDS